MHQFYIILVSIILEVAYNVLNRKYIDNFSFINFIYVIKVYFILFVLIYFIKVYIILFQITYLFYFMIILFAINFSCIYWLFWAIRPWNWKAFQMNSEKLDTLHVQNGQSLSKYQDFIWKLVCFNRHFKWTTKRLKVGMVSS